MLVYEGRLVMVVMLRYLWMRLWMRLWCLPLELLDICWMRYRVDDSSWDTSALRRTGMIRRYRDSRVSVRCRGSPSLVQHIELVGRSHGQCSVPSDATVLSGCVVIG